MEKTNPSGAAGTAASQQTVPALTEINFRL
jgi:hypothetical protein